MTPEDEKILELTVEGAVQRGVAAGVAPIWEKINTHETAIALDQQELRNGIRSQMAQGERLGVVERTTADLCSTLKAHRWWLVGIGSLVVGAAVKITWFLITKGA